MELVSRKNRTALRAARAGLNAFGTFKHAQGRISARRSARTRAELAGAAGCGVLIGMLASPPRLRSTWERARGLTHRTGTDGHDSSAEQTESPEPTPINGERAGAISI
jgi:hypothetical protein